MRLPQTGHRFGCGLPVGSSPCGSTARRPWSARPLRSSSIAEPSTLLASRSAPAPCGGAPRPRLSPLAVLPLAPASRGCPSPTERPRRHSGRQVLLLSASACNGLTPPLAPGAARTARKAASWLRERRYGRAFLPEERHASGFAAVLFPCDASAEVHTCSSSRRSPRPLTGGPLPRSPPSPAPERRLAATIGALRLHGEPGGPLLHHWRGTVRADDLLHRHPVPFRFPGGRATRGG